jgi:HPt (histidine-containing phosphotransfer) domain-containing protein
MSGFAARLSQLMGLAGPDIRAQVIKDLAQCRDELAVAIRTGDMTRVQRVAHALAGLLGTVGAETHAATARAICDLALADGRADLSAALAFVQDINGLIDIALTLPTGSGSDA